MHHQSSLGFRMFSIQDFLLCSGIHIKTTLLSFCCKTFDILMQALLLKSAYVFSTSIALVSEQGSPLQCIKRIGRMNRQPCPVYHYTCVRTLRCTPLVPQSFHLPYPTSSRLSYPCHLNLAHDVFLPSGLPPQPQHPPQFVGKYQSQGCNSHRPDGWVHLHWHRHWNWHWHWQALLLGHTPRHYLGEECLRRSAGSQSQYQG